MNKVKSDLLGDMPETEFRENGIKVIEWISKYFSEIEKYRVVSKIKPGEIEKSFPEEAPENSIKFELLLEKFEKEILPGITHWNHPNFFAYFNSTSSSPGILGELLSAALNVNGMIWKTSPAATELESVVMNWLRKMIGLDDEFWGIIYDTASVSSFHALASAREEYAGIDIREKGLYGAPKMTVYLSELAHSSIDKAVLTLGLGLENMRKIKTDKNFKLDSNELRKKIRDDKEAGYRPICVVATVGTTSLGSIDNVSEIGKIAKEENIWFHVDAAYGGSAAVAPEFQYILNGCELADSLVVNPHKWLFTPIDFSAFYTKKPDALKRAFSLIPEYLKTQEDSEVKNLMDYGIQLGRRFRALKFWLIVSYFGREGLAARVRDNIRLAKKFADFIEGDPDFELILNPELGLTAFRLKPARVDDLEKINELNLKLMNEINLDGKIYFTHTKIDNRVILRFSVSGLRTMEEHVDNAWKEIQSKWQELSKIYPK